MLLDDDPGLIAVANSQAGVVSRQQAHDAGLSDAAIGHRLRRGLWRRELPGVYLTFTGLVTDSTRACARLLYAGPSAALGAEESLAAWGLRPWPRGTWTLLIARSRRVRDQPGLSVRTASALEAWAHPSATPRRLRIEPAALLVADRATRPQDVIDVVLAVTSGRRTTARRLSDQLDAWSRVRWRSLLAELLADVEDGVASPLERRWRRDVELAHGLPEAERNALLTAGARRMYRDIRYRGYPVVVELDGQLAHPAGKEFRDRERDNLAARRREYALRYGWREVFGDPCGCCREVFDLLRQLGYAARIRACGPFCSALPAA